MITSVKSSESPDKETLSTRQKRSVNGLSLELKDVTFTLPKSFIKKYKGKQPDWGALGYVTYKRTYARSLFIIDEEDRPIYYKQKREGDTLSYIYFNHISDDETQLFSHVNLVFTPTQTIPRAEFDVMKDEKNIPFNKSEGKLIYTGKTEEYWQTIKRVVEGCFAIEKWHCKMPQHNYSWNEKKAIVSAKRMYEKMWEGKFLPAGRGLWMMGTEFIAKFGSMALNNCGFTSTEYIRSEGSKSFEWMMDALMLGVGVGFDVDGGFPVPKIEYTFSSIEELQSYSLSAISCLSEAEIFEYYTQQIPKEYIQKAYLEKASPSTCVQKWFENEKIKNEYVEYDIKLDAAIDQLYASMPENQKNKYVLIQKPECLSETYVIPDSRKGWVKSLAYLLDAYFFSKDELRTNNDLKASDPEYDGSPLFEGLPIFDYSLIRKKGEPIRGFGGKASGPDPLIKMHEHLSRLLTHRINHPLRTTDIAFIATNIGKCVVAGNVRRSAEIALGCAEDYGYSTMKEPRNISHYYLNEEHLNSLWACNASIFAEVGMNYDAIAQSIVKNGEPGLFFLKNAQEYGRMKETEHNYDDMKVKGCNPCFHPDTLIAVADGRNAVSIKQLADEGKDIPVYSVSPEGIVEIKMGRNPRLTQKDQELVKITLDDGSSVIVTPTHGMRVLNGTRVEAKDLRIGDSLPRFNKSVSKMGNKGTDYYRVSCDTLDARHKKIFEHRLIAQFHYPDQWNNLYESDEEHGWLHGNLVVHHKDGNGLNNCINNLEILKFSEHAKEHDMYNNAGENNPMFGKEHSDQTKQLIGQSTKSRCENPEYRAKLSDAIKRGMQNPDVIREISEAKINDWIKYYEDFEQTTDMDTVWIEGRLFVTRPCDTCGKDMILPIRLRHQCYCSRTCMNKSTEHTAARNAGQQKYFADKQKNILHQQITLYKELERNLHRNPSKKEWEEVCRVKKISFRCNPKSENNFVLKSFKDLQERSISYNHAVIKVEKICQHSDVYSLTVDDNHTIGIITSETINGNKSGIFAFQCVEQSLESFELCCLGETFPARHSGCIVDVNLIGRSMLTYLIENKYNIVIQDKNAIINPNDFKNAESLIKSLSSSATVTLDAQAEYIETLKYAYLYEKTVTLLNTHWSKTNTVMHRNRRIGTSQTGITDAIKKFGLSAMIDLCEKGYTYLRTLDHVYREWLCVSHSKKLTTVKPSGCQVKETLVNTENGIFHLNELGNIRGNQWQDIQYITTLKKDIAKFYVNGKTSTKKIITNDGNVLECSLQHKYRVWNGEASAFNPEKMVWKTASELQIRDQLISILDDYVNTNEVKLTTVLHQHNKEYDMKQPTEMSPQLAWFIGHVFANGSIHERSLRISFNRKQADLVIFIRDLVKDLFNINANVDDEHSITINSTQLLAYLEANKMLKNYSYNIYVPKCIRTSSRESIKGFINGFWRGDGGQQHPTTWTMCSVSHQFMLELLAICRAIGWNVKISNAGCGGFGSKDRWILQSRNMQEENARYQAKSLKNRYHKINGITYWIDPIECIEDSENETFDISVPDGNEYIANGVISHNTLSLLFGASPGIHFPHSEYHIRRIRIEANSPIIKECKRCGYNVYHDPTSRIEKENPETGKIEISYNTDIVEFPIHEKNFYRGKDDVSLWEQAQLVSLWQEHWSDNQVSCTLTFKNHEIKDIPRVIEMYQYKWKGVSFLPAEDHGYENAPYEKITKDQYEAMMQKITGTLDFSDIVMSEGSGEKFCTDVTCERKQEEARVQDIKKVSQHCSSLDPNNTVVINFKLPKV